MQNPIFVFLFLNVDLSSFDAKYLIESAKLKFKDRSVTGKIVKVHADGTYVGQVTDKKIFGGPPDKTIFVYWDVNGKIDPAELDHPWHIRSIT